jgi:multicomponent Na+:H+ antiporter subunit A
VPETWLVAPATWAVYGDPTVEVDLYLFREVNAAFILSLVTFAVGFVLYLARIAARAAGPRDRGNPLKFDPGWDRTLDGLKALAEWQTRILQSGVLQRYMVIIFATLAIGMGGTIWAARMRSAPSISTLAEELDGLVFKHWAVLVFITAGALLTAYTAAG